MFCAKCGNELTQDSRFCIRCGAQVGAGGATPASLRASAQAKTVLCQIPQTEKRPYSIVLDRRSLSIQGKFWYLREKEFVRASGSDSAEIRNFLGMGYLSKRSPRMTILFVVAASILEVVKIILDQLSDLADKANRFLRFIGESVAVPEWMNVTMNVLAVLCLLLAVALFFSKKKMIEISFKDKRICVPQNSMTQQEFQTLYYEISHAKEL